MPLVIVLLVLAVLGLAVLAFNKYIDKSPDFKKLINTVAIVGAIIWVMKVWGIWAYLMTIKI